MPVDVQSSRKITPLGEMEVQVIDLFIRGVQVLGLPKSIGEIYGMLFVTPKPVALDTLVERLGISRGSASQGLRFLRNLGAVKPEYVPGERRDHYVAETSLKKLVGGFVRGALAPHVESGVSRVTALRALAEADSSEDSDFRAQRIDQIEHWLSKGGNLLGVVEKFFT
jgi:DNA-binding transcriptional regulator GbsR (MarR family)